MLCLFFPQFCDFLFLLERLYSQWMLGRSSMRIFDLFFDDIVRDGNLD